MTEKAKKIHIELKGGESGITSFAGLWPAVELFRKSGLPEVIDSAVGARSSRGYRDSDHILSLILLHLSGGSAADHLPFLKEKLSFGKLGISVPSPSALRTWLKEFHNGEEDGKRGMGKAFIPEENGHLKGLGTVLSRLFAFAAAHSPREHITLDQDATFIETEESGANWNYKGQKSYQALNTYCPEYDLVAGSRYGDGNVPPGWKQQEELERILESLPDEVKGVSLRSDSAGYQTDLLTWCTEGKHSRFGYIPVGISCPVGEEFKKAVRAVPEEDRRPGLPGRGKSLFSQSAAPCVHEEKESTPHFLSHSKGCIEGGRLVYRGRLSWFPSLFPPRSPCADRRTGPAIRRWRSFSSF